MIPNSNFQLPNSRILVTGASGFIGSHLVEELVKRGANVVSLDLNFKPKSYFKQKELHKKTKTVKVDICDYNTIFKVLKSYKINGVFHLAAVTLVEDSYNNPLKTLNTNIMGTSNILEATRLYGKINSVLIASSDKAYGKLEKGQKYLESDSLYGNHPYEVSKSAADLISTMYAKTYNLPVSVARFGNVYGEGDFNFSRLIPGIMEAIIKNRTFNIRSNGKYIRDYIYVKDVIDGYISLSENINKTRDEAFNFGSRDSYNPISMIILISKILNKKIDYKILNNAKNEIPYQSLNYSKVYRLLGWKPQYNIRSTITNIFTWYKSQLT